MSFLTITQRLARSFDEVPNNAAVWARGKSLSYREFGDRSARIATLLRKNGVGRGDRVAILSHRVDSMYISVAGVLLAGATYVALNPRFPSLRNKLILAESEAKALLIEERCAFAMGDATLDTPALKLVLFPDAEMVTPIPGKKVCGRQSLNFSTDALDPDLHACGSDLVYIVFTSGTTGKPKGVQITHSNLISYVDNINSF